jgi:DNA-directed RNA polymerase specialized sigma24 family protein
VDRKRERHPAPISSLSDADLLDRSAADPSSFGILFDRHADRIYAYVVRRVGPSLSEELTAETTVQA